MRDQVLTVDLKDNLLTISIGIDMLAKATELSPSLEDIDDDGDFHGPKVVNKKVWAREVLQGLQDEEEDGTTPVHRMLDSVFERLAEGGAEGIRMSGDDD